MENSKLFVVIFCVLLEEGCSLRLFVSLPFLPIVVMPLLLSSFLSAGAAVSSREKGRRTRRGTNDEPPPLWQRRLLLRKKVAKVPFRKILSGMVLRRGLVSQPQRLVPGWGSTFIPLQSSSCGTLLLCVPGDKPFCDVFFCRR